jgi:hypothetical protein
LSGVSCVHARSCVAVGLSIRGGVDQTLVESGRGARWSIVASPNAGASDNAFSAVSCASARWCVAVGFYLANGIYQTLIESWNGVRWSIAPSPNFGTVNNLLDGVSCVSARSCQAVGWDFDSNNGVESTLIESWNGSGWSIVPSPNRGLAGNIIVSVSCVASTSCKAVGYTIPANQAPAYETLIESWNGVAWSIVPSPNQPTSASLLLAVSCVSANDLLAVSCTSARACEAVGLYFNVGRGNYQTLIESWNGISWSLVPSANRGTDVYNVLAAVSCPPKRTSCTAVGNYFDTTLNTYQTLIETNHYR